MYPLYFLEPQNIPINKDMNKMTIDLNNSENLKEGISYLSILAGMNND